MAAPKGTLNCRNYITPSGLHHPYYIATSHPRDPDTTMYARLSVYPPLDQDTVIPPSQNEVIFNVLLEKAPSSANATADSGWSVELWHNHSAPDKWDALPLTPTPDGSRTARGSSVSSKGQKWFVGRLARPQNARSVSIMNFTLRFRSSSDSAWRWIRDATGTPDGQIIFQQKLPADVSPADLIEGADSAIRMSEERSETSNTRVWLCTAPVAAAQDPQSGWTRQVLGTPKSCNRWFALVRLWSPWLSPRQGRGTSFAERRAILYTFQRQDGHHVVVLAVSGIQNVLTTIVNDNGKLVLQSRNDALQESTARVCLSFGETFDDALAASMYLARKLVSSLISLPAEHLQLIDERQAQAKMEAEKKVRTTWAEDWIDGFTYCTWNGLGQNLTEEKVRTALKSLEDNNISITNLIIDDNWQSLDNEGANQFHRGWTDFEANPKGWPQGLKHAANSIRQKHPSIRHIGVWHALMGYWGGVSPHGTIAQKYKIRKVLRRENLDGASMGVGPVHVVDGSDIGRMYKDFYAFLEDAGIDAVKTDAQFAIDELDESDVRRELTNAYLDAWNIAQLRYMSAHAISCMSQVPQIIFHSQLPNHAPAVVLRNTDDFFPSEEASHPWHIFWNAHNAHLTKNLNAVPDWDMFQTVHKWSRFHAAARCISGGPIYVTDEPGKHDTGLIREMTAPTIRGQTVILRPSVVARGISPYVGYEEERLLCIGSWNGYAQTGTSFMGVFNCRFHELTEIIHLGQFLGTEKGEWLVRSHHSGQIGRVMSLDRPEEAVEAVTLDTAACDVLTARPVQTLKSEQTGKSIRIADFGLLGQMTGAAAIISTHASVEVPGKRAKIQTMLKALGRWGFWVDKPVPSVDDLVVMIQGKPVPPHTVSVQPNGMVETDLERAWSEMGLSSIYSNELPVSAYIPIL